MKKYNKIENYFVDKEQLKRYKNNQLLPGEEIVLTNNNNIGILNIEIDSFGDARVKFVNSRFYDFELKNYSKNSYSNILLDNCNISKCYFDLNSKSKVSIDNCELQDLKVFANEININDSYCNPSYNEKVILGNAYAKTNTISLNHFTYEMGFFSEFCSLYSILDTNIQPVITTSKSLIIKNSSMKLDSNSKVVNISNSSIKINNLKAENAIFLNKCNVNNSYYDCNKSITSPIIFISGKNILNKHSIKSELLFIRENSELINNSVKFEIDDKIILKSNSKLINNRFYSYLAHTPILLQHNSSIDIEKFKYKNTYDSKQEIILNELEMGHQNLVKTLGLVRNKYNVPVKKLDIRR